MKIGAAAMIHAWGRPMTLTRNAILLASFVGKRYEARANSPEEFPLDYSLDQDLFWIVAAVEDFLGVVPQKFDVIGYNNEEYTVQKARVAGADEDEVVRLLVKGGKT